jgi:nicotinate-nucleotide adenylyltransferase
VSGVGILGGAFDPPHRGHVQLARAAIEYFDLDRLLVRVVEKPGHKPVRTDASIRLHLAELAFGQIDEAEVGLDIHPRTVDSLRALGLDDPIFLTGADEFASFLDWKDPDGVLDLAVLGVANRPGVSDAAQQAVLSKLRRPDRVRFFPIEPLSISSSEIRRRAAVDAPVADLVPPAVAAEITRLQLYADAGS